MCLLTNTLFQSDVDSWNCYRVFHYTVLYGLYYVYHVFPYITLLNDIMVICIVAMVTMICGPHIACLTSPCLRHC